MKRIKAAKYVEGVESIYVEQPQYETGHDGSDGFCDCIGMCRGGLKRGGATGVTGMHGTNQAARQTILNLEEIAASSQLQVGDVVLKVRDKDDKSMPLPDKYRKGGSEYDPLIGEINFTHIGTVTQQNPLVITHMTTPTAKKDKSIKGWGYFGELPWIEYEAAPEPPPEPNPEPDPEEQTAIVWAEKGSTVKMRAKPSTSCRLYWDVPIGDEVTVNEYGTDWCGVTWNGIHGYMMTRFLKFDEKDLYTVTIPNVTREQAEELCATWPGATMERK